jgi:hypothetical protein
VEYAHRVVPLDEQYLVEIQQRIAECDSPSEPSGIEVYLFADLVWYIAADFELGQSRFEPAQLGYQRIEAFGVGVAAKTPGKHLALLNDVPGMGWLKRTAESLFGRNGEPAVLIDPVGFDQSAHRIADLDPAGIAQAD